MPTGRLPLALVLAACAATSRAQPTPALQQLNQYLNRIGIEQVERRAEEVARISTRAEAERRQTEVRAKILGLIGGLLERSGPVAVKQYATTKGDGFSIENIAYESLPGFYVTANVYVPSSGNAPFPAIVVTPGHGAGKQSEFNWAANFARNGIVALVVDPLAQGERMQHWDPEIGNSKIERLGEHEHASLSSLLIGDHVSRYFINDGMRGIDYLTQRKDVDAAHLGAFGCSGGGTITAYLAALDPRVAVAASACYITSMKELFPTQGPQDAEQTLPNFTAAGLDFADWVELVAPRPYAIVSTTQDMFPYAGAQQTFTEARRFYSLFGAETRLQWITGPGGHGNLGPIANDVLTFLASRLKKEHSGEDFRQFRAPDADDLTATPSGQISLSLSSKSAEAINRERAATLKRPTLSVDALREEVRRSAAIAAQTGAAAPAVKVVKEDPKDGYRLQTLSFASEPGIDLPAIQALPAATGPRPAIVMLDEIPAERTSTSADFTRFAKAGYVAVALQPRGAPIDAQNGVSQQFSLGPYMAVNLRAIVVGKTLVGMRADDVIRAVDWLASRDDIDRSKVTLYGKGALGMVALHAAAVDTRIARVVTENTLVSYQIALDAPLHRNLSEITIPGVLKRYDTPDLLRAILPRDVVIVNPMDAVGQPVRLDRAREALAAPQARIVRRTPRDPLPID